MTELLFDKNTGSFNAAGLLLRSETCCSDLTKTFFAESPCTLTGPDFLMCGPLNPVMLWGALFGMSIRFYKQTLHSVTLSLTQGEVARLGYDAEEKHLLNEKKKLSSLLEKSLGQTADQFSLACNTFDFSWGSLRVIVDLKSTWCGIEVQY
jgi:hypothetical protein